MLTKLGGGGVWGTEEIPKSLRCIKLLMTTIQLLDSKKRQLSTTYLLEYNVSTSFDPALSKNASKKC